MSEACWMGVIFTTPLLLENSWMGRAACARKGTTVKRKGVRSFTPSILLHRQVDGSGIDGPHVEHHRSRCAGDTGRHGHLDLVDAVNGVYQIEVTMPSGVSGTTAPV